MTSAPAPSHSDLTNSNNNTRTQIRSPTHQEVMKPSTDYLLGSRARSPRAPVSQQQPEQTYTTTRAGVSSLPLTKIQRGSQADYDFELLRHLADDFGALLNRIDMSDCFLRVQGIYMAVHRCVLAARSNTFAAVISGTGGRSNDDGRDQLERFTEKEKLVIVIDKTEPETMKQVIIFMYTSKCDISEHNAYELLHAAGRYDIKSLKVYTGRYLVDRINTNNLIMLLEAAYRYNNLLLKQHCIGYFLQNSKEVMSVHQTWKPFADKYPSIVAELLYWVVHPQEFVEKNKSYDQTTQW